jgi:hypothetical protein
LWGVAGTTPSTSQLAKDVSTFLAWSAEPEHDQRKQMGFKAMFVLTLLTGKSTVALPLLYPHLALPSCPFLLMLNE